MKAGGGLFFYGTTLYISLSQPRLLVSVSSIAQNKYKKQTVSAHFLKKEKEKSKKESVPKQLNRCFPSLYSALFLPVHVFVTPVKQSSSRRPLRKNCYTFRASQNLFGSKLSVCSSTHWEYPMRPSKRTTEWMQLRLFLPIHTMCVCLFFVLKSFVVCRKVPVSRSGCN